MAAEILSIEDQEILERYPLPIAHEYRQLLEKKDWRPRCRQLMDLLDSSLRYCVVIVVSNYFEGQSIDERLDQWLARKLVDPQLEDLLEILKRIIAVYRDQPEKLYISELYPFCYDPEGNRSTALGLVERLVEGFVKPLRSQEEAETILMSHQELYESNAPLVKELLSKMAFLKNYVLLRMIEREEGGQWQFHKLMGCEIREDVSSWQAGARPQKSGMALWGGNPQRLLLLHPFALFETCQECRTAFYSPPEELFLYRETKEGEAIYFGLREDNVGLTHRIHSKEMPDEIRLVLHVAAWPPGLMPLEEYQRVLDWSKLRGYAATQSKDQLERYRKEKYSGNVYFQREAVEEDLQHFLESEKNGFLVVGDSGTGKTNLFCHLVEKTLENAKDIVLFYNCAELPKEVNLGKIVASQLGKQKDFGTLLDRIEKERGEGKGQFLLVLDALNEYQDPRALLESLWQDVLSEVPLEVYEWFKVVISCRTEAWHQLERHFRGIGLFYETADGVEMRLHKFTPEELSWVYERYREKYDLKSEFTQLSEATKRFIADPLMLKLVAESHRGQVLLEDPRTVEVFDHYFREKVGDKDDLEMDKLEKRVVKRLVELMYQAKTDELAEKDLWDDEPIGQAVMASNSLNSPYFRLLDKGILMQVKVGGIESGVVDLFGDTPTQAKTKVRFTYDRFFEYLLAFFVLPGEVTVPRVKELMEEAYTHRYISLRGAVKLRLLSYIEQRSDALYKTGVITLLALDADYKIRGLLEDTLITFGTYKLQVVAKFLTEVLLSMDSDTAGLLSLLVGYQLEDIQVIKAALYSPSEFIRQTAMQFVYFFWTRHPEEVDVFLNQLGREASEEVVRSFPVLVVSGRDIDFKKMYALSAFLGVNLYLGANLMTDPDALRRFSQMWQSFFKNFPKPVRGIANKLLKGYIGKAFVEGHRANISMGPISLDNIAIFTHRTLDDPVRAKLRECAQYMAAKIETIQVADKVFEIGQISDGTVGLVVHGILISHSISYPDQSLQLMKRMYYEGNSISKYNVVRGMSMALQRPNPPQAHLDFFKEAVLGLWMDQEPVGEMEGRPYKLGHFGAPIIFECRQKRTGRLDFVDEFMQKHWKSSRTEQILVAIENLGLAGLFLSSYPDAHHQPLLDTLQQWFDFSGENEKETMIVRQALARALGYIWLAFPDEAEEYLENEPELMGMVFEKMEAEADMLSYSSRISLNNLMSASLGLPKVVAGLIMTIQRICDEITDVEVALHMVAGYLMDIDTLKLMAEGA